MNTGTLRNRRIVLPAVAAVAAVGIGGAVWVTAANADVRGSERDRVADAAAQAAGGGTAVDVETSDDLGVAYEVEIVKRDGTEVDVALDQDLGVVFQDVDDDRDDDLDDRYDRDDRLDRDDRALSADERRRATNAARDAVAGGTVVDVEASDDRGVAYEVEVHDADHVDWDVELDADFQVVRKHVDD